MNKLDAGTGASRTLRGDLRAAIPDVAISLIASGIAFALLVASLHAGTNAAVLEMPDMVQNGGIWPYSASQAVGWGALLCSWTTILLGVSLPYLAQQQRVRFRERIERLHRSTSLTVVALMVVHAVLLVWDKMGDTLLTCFVPWTTPYLPGRFPQMLGIVSFYLAVFLGLTFYLREKIGRRTWRALHQYLVPGVYVLAVWHTLAYGSDVKTGNAVWVAILTMQFPVIVGFAIRLFLSPRRGRETASAPL